MSLAQSFCLLLSLFLKKRSNMKNLLISLALVFSLSALLSSCVHAPKQAWTPRNNKGTLVNKKPMSAKSERKLKHVKVW